MTTETRPTAAEIALEQYADALTQLRWLRQELNAADMRSDHATIGRLHSGIVRLVRREQARRGETER